MDAPEVIQVLDALDYAAETDWLPVRIELRAPGDRWVDVHPAGTMHEVGPDFNALSPQIVPGVAEH